MGNARNDQGELRRVGSGRDESCPSEAAIALHGGACHHGAET